MFTDCRATVRELLRTMGGGPKVLYLDSETKGMISVIITFSELLETNYLLVETVSNIGSLEVSGMVGVIFCRGTAENISTIVERLKLSRGLTELNLIFTTPLENEFIERLARADAEAMLIHRVLELYLDYYMMRSNCFSLELPGVFGMMSLDNQCWMNHEDKVFNRCVDGLVASILTVSRHVSQGNILSLN